MRNLVEDFRFAFRQLRRSSVYAAIVVLILTLGIGANTAVFSVMDAVLMRQLPVSRASGLYYIHVAHPEEEILPFQYTFNSDNLPLGVFEALRWHGEIFEELITYAPLQGAGVLSVRHGSMPEIARGTEVSGNFFSGLGVRLEKGRGFTPQDERTHAPLAVLSYDFWTRSYARDPGVVGQTIYVKGVPITIVGIAARGFKGVPSGEATGFWVPFQNRLELNAWGFSPEYGSLYNTSNFAWLRLIARLRPGVTPEKAQQATAGLFSQAIVQIAGKLDPRIGQPLLGFVPVRGIEYFDRFYGRSIWILMGLVVLVLLIACTNVSMMAKARNLYLEREFSLRVALGASKGTVFRQLFVEGVILVSVGAILGWLVAIVTTYLLAVGFGIQTGLGPNRAVLLFTVIISSLAALSFGLAPLHNAVNAPIAGVLRLRSHSVTSSREYVLKGRFTLVTQMAFSLTLLMAASLLVRTLQKYATEELGMDADRILVFGVPAPRSSNAAVFCQTLLERIRKYPGVESASMAQTRLGTGAGSSCEQCGFVLDGAQQRESKLFYFNFVGPAYFQTMGIPIVAGREFNSQDVRNSPIVAIVNETLVQQYFGNNEPIGHKIKSGFEDRDATIVGVAHDSKYMFVSEPKRPEIYYAASQQPSMLGDMDVELRARGDAASLVPAMRKIVAALSSEVPIDQPMTLRAQFDESYREQRMFAIMGAVFGLLAMLVVAVGIFGVHSFHVRRRRVEIGVRMAFGARKTSVLAMVLKENLKVLAVGVIVGAPLSLLVAGLLKSMLYKVSPFDWLSFIIAAGAIGMVSIGAAIGPARRAAAVVPMQALRTD